MRRIVRAQGLRPLIAIIPLVVAAGCGSSPPPGDARASGPAARQTIGAAGGVLSSASGDLRLEVPPGAVDHDVAFSIQPLSAPPAGSVGTVFEIGPSGTTFRVPVRLTFTPAPADTARTELDQLAVAVFQDGAWAQLDGQAADPVARTVSATTTHLSIYGMVRGCAVGAICDPNPAPFILSRWWEFTTQYPGSRDTRFGGPVREGRVVSDFIEFGPQVLSPAGALGIARGSDVARGMVFSNETGGTYWALAEAPTGTGPHGATGGESILNQVQYFRKQSAGAWLRLRVTSVVLEAIDTDATPCVPGGSSCLYEMLAAVAYDVKGAKAPPGGDPVSFFDFEGHAILAGYHGHWFGPVESYGPIVQSPWKESSFQFEPDLEGDGGSHARLRLPAPITIEVPLSSVSVGDEVRLEIHLRATSRNNRGGESYIGAYFEDPAMADDLAITFEGMEPVAGPANPPPAADPPRPAVCPGAPDPAAGTLQLAAPAISAGEQVGPDARVVVTRQGGSRGEVSAVLRSAGGSATAGADYTPVDRLVRFADGQDGAQVVLVGMVDDAAVEPPETVMLALSDPRGCVALGAQASAVLTIVDDDLPPVPTHTVGGVVQGLAGSGLVLTSLGADLPIAASGRFAFPLPRVDGQSYDVQVKTQPSNPNQVCAVQRGTGRVAGADVTDVQVDCQAPAAPGSLDPTFGSGGLVFSSKSGFADGSPPLAIDAEGGVLVAGGVSDAFGLADFALARFTADGRPDPGFGAAGLAIAGFGSGYDVARALAVQADGKIVVVGETSPNAASGAVRFALARFLPSGSLDPQFGVGGQVTTNFDASYNRVAALLVQRDGRILVAGSTAVTSAAGRVQVTYALARFLPDGTLDPSFGVGGKAAPVVGDGARAQSLGVLDDGRIVVAGLVGDRGGAARYDAAGALDSGFGAAGFLTLDLDSAPALAVQSDGQVIVVGSRPSPAGERDFAILRLGLTGALDRGFGNQGSAIVDFPAASDDDYAAAVALGPGGTIVVAGSTSDRARPSNLGGDFALARLTAAGALDTTFGTGGLEVHDFFGAFDGARGVALAPGGALVVGGPVRNGTTPGFGLLRLRAP